MDTTPIQTAGPLPEQPSILRAFGWRFALVLTKDLVSHPERRSEPAGEILHGQEIAGMNQSFRRKKLPNQTAHAHQEKSSDKRVNPAFTQTAAAAAEKEKNTVGPPPVPTSADAVRHFEFVGGSSQKFCGISLSR